MKEVVVISGKGGTGKTSITSSFAVLGGSEMVVGDCDVDADDMHLILKPDYASSEDFYSGYTAVIDQSKCTGCGICSNICRFRAVEGNENGFLIDPLSCEGCGYCAEVCPAVAIELIDADVGEVFESKIKTGARMVHARLKPGADNSGKLVARVKQTAKKYADENNIDLILIDGSPGIGCPVVSSLTGANFVMLVTEPSVSGVHDLKRVYELVKRFKIKAGLIINKKDLNEDLVEELKRYADAENIALLAELPYHEDFTRALTEGKTPVEYDNNEIRALIEGAWNKALFEINKEK